MISATFIGPVFALLMMAVAVGMDAFSVSMGMGMIGLRLRQIIHIGFLIGTFHVIMPLTGMIIGHILSEHFGWVAQRAGGTLLLILGAQMVLSSFRDQEKHVLQPAGIGMLVFAVSVSLDSFSVGLSLGIFGARVLITVVLFGVVTTVMTWCGLLVGRKFQHVFGSYSEALGGCILFAFGIKLFLYN